MKRASPKAPRVEAKSDRPRLGRLRLLLFILLAIIAAGAYPLGRQLWAYHHLGKARQALADGESALALAELDRCLAVWPHDAEVHLLAARADRSAGHAAESARQLRAARDAGGDEQEIALQTELLDAATGKLEQVEGALRRRVDAGHPARHEILDVLVRAYLARGRIDDGERAATGWIDEAPGDWRPWFLRGIARSAQSKQLLSTAFEQARRDYEKVLELKPNYAPARLLLGNAYIMTGQFADALPHLERYVALKPEDPNGVAELARCLRGLARVDEAQRALDAWLTDHPGTPDVFLIRGQVALDLGRPEEGLDWDRRAEKLAPTAEKTLFQVAQALRAAGRAEEAQAYEKRWRERRDGLKRLAELEKTAAEEPTNVAARHEAGVVALGLGEQAVAMRWLAEVLKLDPNHRPTHRVLAEQFQKMGNAEAAAFHRRLADKGP